MVDLLFRSHGLAEYVRTYFASINWLFLTLPNRNNKHEALTNTKQRLAKGQVARGVINAHGQELVVYKNPRLGTTPPPPPGRLFPFLTSYGFGVWAVQSGEGRRWTAVVACYWEFSWAVDGANHMALQLCIMTR